MPQQRARVYLRGGQTIDMVASKITLTIDQFTGALTQVHATNSAQGYMEFLRGDAVDAVVRLNEGE